MQVTQERLDPCQVALTIEVEQDKVVHAVDKAYREYSKYVTVPGFRKGKAPLNFVKQRVPESDVRQRTAEILVEPAYEEALKETEIEPYAQPKLELVQLDLTEKPFIFKAIVPLAPVVELGEYKGLSATKTEYQVSDADVDAEIDQLRNRAAQYPLAERPIEKDDVVVADVFAKVEGRPELEEPRGTMIQVGGDNIDGFDDAILGAVAGDTRTFPLTYPETYPDESLQGQPVEFTVTVKEVRAKQLPELDDELAKAISNNKIETLDALRNEIKSRLEKYATDTSNTGLESSLIGQIVTNAKIDYPAVLVDSELESDYKELMHRIEHSGNTLEGYLESQGKTRDQLIGELREQADRRVRVGLVLGEVVRAENLQLTEDDLDEYITDLAIAENATPAAVRAMIENRGSLESLRNRAQTAKVLAFIKDSASIEVKTVDFTSAHEADGAKELATEASEE